MSNTLSYEKKQQILELYFCSNDRRLWVISEITGSTPATVSMVVQNYFAEKIIFDRGAYQVIHSSINNYN